MKISFLLAILIAFNISLSALAQPTTSNSNYWVVHRDDQAGFRISYPPSWIVVQPKGRNVRFSVNPPDGPGNCNVVARQNAEISGMSQALLNSEIEALPQDQVSWAEYAGLPAPKIRLLESRVGKIFDTPALVGVIESTLENLEGEYTRKQIVALTFRPGVIWSLNCGATSFKQSEARARFYTLKPSFNKIFGSFAFLR
jgi:hypothetical protein